MWMSQLIGGIFFLIYQASCENFTDADAATYFKNYGYVNISDNSIFNLKSLLVDFQEKYNLPVDGALNNETIELMKKPRCNLPDDFSVYPSKWNKTHLRWYFLQAQKFYEYFNVAQEAFNIWEKNSNLKFEYVQMPTPKPDITISMQSKVHKFRKDCQGTANCPNNFDGPGKTLAHAYSPTNNDCTEIHLDIEENWYLGLNGTIPDTQTSLLMVLVHEIGHSLGLAHSGVATSIMYPWYQDNITSLSDDDKAGIEFLYPTGGKRWANIPKTTTTAATTSSTHQANIPKRRSSTTTSTPTSTIKYTRTSTSTTTAEPEIHKELCEVIQPDFIFLAMAPEFQNYRLYIGHKTLLWKLDLNNIKVPSQAENIVDYLPKEIKNSSINYIFQNSDDNLVAVDNYSYFITSFPGLQIKEKYSFDIPNNAKINAVFQTNSGKNYLFYNNAMLIEFKDHSGETVRRAHINDIFPGLPGGVTSAFKYIDGHIYFFYGSTYYKYNEYLRKVVMAGPFDWNVLGLPCPNVNLLQQLKNLLNKVISFYD